MISPPRRTVIGPVRSRSTFCIATATLGPSGRRTEKPGGTFSIKRSPASQPVTSTPHDMPPSNVLEATRR